jgi:glycosyltransferase involved in cell wall biosynthesis
MHPMNARSDGVRVLYSFPHKIGAGRICETAWQQVAGATAAGASMTVFPGSVARPLPNGVRVNPTLARGRVRLPYRVFGHQRLLDLHDRIVARRLPALAGSIDLVHTWPSGARETLKAAAKLGIPTVLERPNAHTRYAYEIVRRESERVGVALPSGAEHAYNPSVLRREEEEFRLADRLLCPSAFVLASFLQEGYEARKLIRHMYGFDESMFWPVPDEPSPSRPFTALFVGFAAVRKGLHYALEAWQQSAARQGGRFLIAGSFLPAYQSCLAPLLSDPSVHVLGHRRDVPELMRNSDVLLLPTVEEGSPLVALEALGSGCVPLVSKVCAGACMHDVNALIHDVGDTKTLAHQISMLYEDSECLRRLRAGAIASAPEVTWRAAGVKLVEAYRDTVWGHRKEPHGAHTSVPLSMVRESGGT